MDGLGLQIILVLVLLLINGVLAGSEIALISLVNLRSPDWRLVREPASA